MRAILPRLRNLLTILVGGEKPVPAAELAERLRISRRTVFRELKSADSVLEPYGLSVGTRAGEGLVLTGAEAGREQLCRDLKEVGGDEPSGRTDRQRRLTLCLFQNPGQKLSVYADRFRVSAATISHDLDDIGRQLEQYGILLARRGGSGTGITGREWDMRRAILGILSAPVPDGGEVFAYPDPDIIMDLRGLAPEIHSVISWMTPGARAAIDRYLSVAIQRVMEGNILDGIEIGRVETPPETERVAAIVEESFGLFLGQGERGGLGLEIAAARRGAESRTPDGDEEMRGLAYRLIECFDPEMAPLLKLDEALVGGLAPHLRSTLVRLRHGIEITDPLYGQIANAYPEILSKCRRAGGVLPGGGRFSESEASLLAAHFGAATLRLAEQGVYRRTVRVGVVCVYGIGTSYLLASQLKKAFGDAVEVEVSGGDEADGRARYDFLVGTASVDGAANQVIVKSPMPDGDDLRLVEEEIRRHARRAVAANGTPVTERFAEFCRTLEDLAADSRALTERCAALRIRADVTFEELAQAAARLPGERREKAKRIFAALLERERVASQVVPELELILLHCRTDGVERPFVSLLAPEGGRFTDPRFKGARSCVVLLAPSHLSRERLELLGGVSSALVKNDAFLTAVIAGNAAAAAALLEDMLREHMRHFAAYGMKG